MVIASWVDAEVGVGGILVAAMFMAVGVLWVRIKGGDGVGRYLQDVGQFLS